jgi:hypothetical protein
MSKKNPMWDDLIAVEKMETSHAGRQFARRLIPTLAGTAFVLLTTVLGGGEKPLDDYLLAALGLFAVAVVTLVFCFMVNEAVLVKRFTHLPGWVGMAEVIIMNIGILSTILGLILYIAHFHPWVALIFAGVAVALTVILAILLRVTYQLHMQVERQGKTEEESKKAKG